MSKHETWRTRMYWESVGGLLIEEFIAVKGTKEQGRRPVDGLIVLGEEKALSSDTSYDITGKDVIVVQTKQSRLGMYLLGQAYFSKLLIQKLGARSVKSVAICGRGDAVMEQLAADHGVEVVVIDESLKPTTEKV